ncbi:hypothetical protein D3C72_1358470 [compost metagenome]
MITHAFCAAIGVQRLITRQAVALFKVFQQLGHQHRRVTFAVILNGTANKADIQPLLRRQYRLQE